MNFFGKVSTIVLVVMSSVMGLNAQSIDSLMYRAYLLGSDHLWETALNSSKNKEPLQKAIAYYGILNNTMASSDEETFDHYVDQALNFMESMEEEGTNKAEALAFRSAIYGFIMGYSPWKGMYYGPKSSGAMEDALNASANSAIVNMISGTSLYYTPDTFGGDKIKAIEAFEKAVMLYEQQGYKGWLYLKTLGHLGNAYKAVGQKQEAIATFEKALDIEPDFRWVSKQLLPSARNMDDQ